MSPDDPLPAQEALPADAGKQAPPNTISIGTRSAWLRTAGTVDGDEDPSLARLRTVRLQPLGEGGQGRVFLVEHLGQLEAHKVLRRRGTDKSVFREALHTRLVEHPNIVKVFGTEEVDGSWVLRMEYVEGRDLARVVDEEGCLSVAEVLPYARQVADALAAAHERGIVHQDLKPSNLILKKDKSGVVVTDFGVSAALRSHASGANGRGGTPIFMAPELLEGRTTGTPRTDVWSLGVTLYFLVTGSYPFAFDELSPVEAVRRNPRDPRDECPQMPQAFWSILQRALARDPDAGFESMGALADALAHFDEIVDCPACGHSIRKDDATTICPRESCGSPLAARAVARAGALIASADALVRCEFSAARRAAERALELTTGEDPTALELCAATDTHAALHEQACDAVTADLESLRLVRCLAALDASRIRFSRSVPLKRLRERLIQALVEVHESTESLATDELRQGHFERAREALGRLREICADTPAERALERALGGPADDLGWLAEEVTRKEAVFEELSAETRRAIDTFNFDTALHTLSRLENEFPAEENVELLERLRRGQDAYRTAGSIDEEQLRAITTDPLAIPEHAALDLGAASAACQRLLDDFPQNAYPGFHAIAERKERLERAGRAVRDKVTTTLAIARRLESERRLSRALEELRAVRPLVADSDLFGPGPRDELEQRIARLDERLDRASRLYTDGTAARERREFAQAALALREVGQLAPHDFLDIGQELSEIATLRDKVGALSERVTREFADLRRGRVAVETAELSFEHAESLYELADDSRRARLLADAAATLGVLLETRRQTLTQERKEIDPVAFLADSLRPLVRGLPARHWTELFLSDPELPRSVATLARAALELGSSEFERVLDDAEQLGKLFTDLHEPLAHPASGGEDDHPSCALAARISTAFAAESRLVKRASRARAVELVRGTLEFAPPALQPGLRRSADRLRREGARARWHKLAMLSVRVLGFLAPIFLVGWLAWAAGRDSGVRAEERDTRQLFASWLLRLDLDDAALAEAHRWFGDDPEAPEGFRAPTPGRVALVEQWANLRAALSDGTSDAELASWLALGGAPRRALLADYGALLAAFDQDVEQAVERRLASLFRRAARDLAGEVRHGPAAERALQVDLERLHAALPAGTAAELRVARLSAAVLAFVDELSSGELAAALGAEDLPERVAHAIESFVRIVDADADAKAGLAAVERAAADFFVRQLRSWLLAAFVDLADRAALGEVEGLSQRAATLIEALEALPRESGNGPALGERPGAAAVNEVRAILSGAQR